MGAPRITRLIFLGNTSTCVGYSNRIPAFRRRSTRVFRWPEAILLRGLTAMIIMRPMLLKRRSLFSHKTRKHVSGLVERPWWMSAENFFFIKRNQSLGVLRMKVWCVFGKIAHCLSLLFFFAVRCLKK